jgi:hypothetical protein
MVKTHKELKGYEKKQCVRELEIPRESQGA